MQPPRHRSASSYSVPLSLARPPTSVARPRAVPRRAGAGTLAQGGARALSGGSGQIWPQLEADRRPCRHPQRPAGERQRSFPLTLPTPALRVACIAMPSLNGSSRACRSGATRRSFSSSWRRRGSRKTSPRRAPRSARRGRTRTSSRLPAAPRASACGQRLRRTLRS